MSRPARRKWRLFGPKGTLALGLVGMPMAAVAIHLENGRHVGSIDYLKLMDRLGFIKPPSGSLPDPTIGAVGYFSFTDQGIYFALLTLGLYLSGLAIGSALRLESLRESSQLSIVGLVLGGLAFVLWNLYVGLALFVIAGLVRVVMLRKS